MKKQTKKILIIDDEPWFMEPIIERLQMQYGYDVIQKRNIERGLKEFQEASSSDHPYDLILVDLMLPYGRGLDIYDQEKTDVPGIYLLKKLRSLDENILLFCYTVITDNNIINQVLDIADCHFAKATSDDEELFIEIQQNLD